MTLRSACFMPKMITFGKIKTHPILPMKPLALLLLFAFAVSPSLVKAQRTDWTVTVQSPVAGRSGLPKMDARTMRLIDRMVRSKADSLKVIEGVGVSTPRDVNGLLSIRLTLSGEGMTADPNVTGYNSVTRLAMERLSAQLTDVWAFADVFVDGHTDNVGPYDENMTVSFRRALAVGNLLVRQGVDSARVETRGFSYDYPLADNHLIEGRDKNRRVEVTICVSADMIDHL